MLGCDVHPLSERTLPVLLRNEGPGFQWLVKDSAFEFLTDSLVLRREFVVYFTKSDAIYGWKALTSSQNIRTTYTEFAIPFLC